MIICRSPSCSDSCPNAGTPTSRSESTSWSGSSDCSDVTASNVWLQSVSSSVTNGSNGLTTTLSNTTSASETTSGWKIPEQVERYGLSISSQTSNTEKNVSCTASIVPVENSAIWQVPSSKTRPGSTNRRSSSPSDNRRKPSRITRKGGPLKRCSKV